MPDRTSRPKRPRRCSIQATTPAAAAITAANFTHSFGSSFSVSFMRSIRHRLEGSGHTPLRLRRAIEKKRADHEVIHFRVHEATIRVVRRANHGFAAHVEGS